MEKDARARVLMDGSGRWRGLRQGHWHRRQGTEGWAGRKKGLLNVWQAMRTARIWLLRLDASRDLGRERLLGIPRLKSTPPPSIPTNPLKSRPRMDLLRGRVPSIRQLVSPLQPPIHCGPAAATLKAT